MTLFNSGGQVVIDIQNRINVQNRDYTSQTNPPKPFLKGKTNTEPIFKNAQLT